MGNDKDNHSTQGPASASAETTTTRTTTTTLATLTTRHKECNATRNDRPSPLGSLPSWGSDGPATDVGMFDKGRSWASPPAARALHASSGTVVSSDLSRSPEPLAAKPVVPMPRPTPLAMAATGPASVAPGFAFGEESFVSPPPQPKQKLSMRRRRCSSMGDVLPFPGLLRHDSSALDAAGDMVGGRRRTSDFGGWEDGDGDGDGHGEWNVGRTGAPNLPPIPFEFTPAARTPASKAGGAAAFFASSSFSAAADLAVAELDRLTRARREEAALEAMARGDALAAGAAAAVDGGSGSGAGKALRLCAPMPVCGDGNGEGLGSGSGSGTATATTTKAMAALRLGPQLPSRLPSGEARGGGGGGGDGERGSNSRGPALRIRPQPLPSPLVRQRREAHRRWMEEQARAHAWDEHRQQQQDDEARRTADTETENEISRGMSAGNVTPSVFSARANVRASFGKPATSPSILRMFLSPSPNAERFVLQFPNCDSESDSKGQDEESMALDVEGADYKNDDDGDEDDDDNGDEGGEALVADGEDVDIDEDNDLRDDSNPKVPPSSNAAPAAPLSRSVFSENCLRVSSSSDGNCSDPSSEDSTSSQGCSGDDEVKASTAGKRRKRSSPLHHGKAGRLLLKPKRSSTLDPLLAEPADPQKQQPRRQPFVPHRPRSKSPLAMPAPPLYGSGCADMLRSRCSATRIPPRRKSGGDADSSDLELELIALDMSVRDPGPGDGARDFDVGVGVVSSRSEHTGFRPVRAPARSPSAPPLDAPLPPLLPPLCGEELRDGIGNGVICSNLLPPVRDNAKSDAHLPTKYLPKRAGDATVAAAANNTNTTNNNTTIGAVDMASSFQSPNQPLKKFIPSVRRLPYPLPLMPPLIKSSPAAGESANGDRGVGPNLGAFDAVTPATSTSVLSARDMAMAVHAAARFGGGGGGGGGGKIGEGWNGGDGSKIEPTTNGVACASSDRSVPGPGPGRSSAFGQNVGGVFAPLSAGGGKKPGTCARFAALPAASPMEDTVYENEVSEESCPGFGSGSLGWREPSNHWNDSLDASERDSQNLNPSASGPSRAGAKAADAVADDDDPSSTNKGVESEACQSTRRLGKEVSLRRAWGRSTSVEGEYHPDDFPGGIVFGGRGAYFGGGSNSFRRSTDVSAHGIEEWDAMKFELSESNFQTPRDEPGKAERKMRFRMQRQFQNRPLVEDTSDVCAVGRCGEDAFDEDFFSDPPIPHSRGLSLPRLGSSFTLNDSGPFALTADVSQGLRNSRSDCVECDNNNNNATIDTISQIPRSRGLSLPRLGSSIANSVSSSVSSVQSASNYSTLRAAAEIAARTCHESDNEEDGCEPMDEHRGVFLSTEGPLLRRKGSFFLSLSPQGFHEKGTTDASNDSRGGVDGGRMRERP